jgi:prepilin-type N-terminal cleavage/methylation domain-containing protein
MSSYKKNGFSMIEMLISLVVASIIIIGIYSFLTSSQRSFTLVQANDGVNRSMQGANRNINDYIKMAGFRNYARIIDQATFPKGDYEFDEDISFKRNSFVSAKQADTSSPNIDLYLRYYGSSIYDDLAPQYVEENAKLDRSNQRMFDCNGDPLSRKQLAVVRLYVDGDNGLFCQQKIINTDDGSESAATVLINPNVKYMMFAFRTDDSADFLLPSEMNDDDYVKVNAIRYGFIVRQSTHQKANSIKANALQYHVLGMTGNDDLVEIPKEIEGDNSALHDMYDLVSGLVIAKNRFFEIN